MTMTIRIAIIGPGKIARDAHLPAIASHGGFTLVATAGGPEGVDSVPHYADLAALRAAGVEVDAVAICTPPGPRVAIALEAWAAGLDVLLEKPPAADMVGARRLVPPPGCVGYAAWHSRHAAAVAAARDVLAARGAQRVTIHWLEDVERWHPGQDWVWRADGFGVIDAGINALSILTLVWPGDWRVSRSVPTVPAGCDAPERVEALLGCGGVTADVTFDWHAVDDRWDIAFELADGGFLQLHEGGARLQVDGADVPVPAAREYDGVYADFARAIAARESRIDVQPLALALALLAGDDG
ncbi:MAG: hypothetical protein RIS17_445 [Pseudomonadota bacterium]